VQSRGKSVQAQKGEFVRMHAARMRPVWLATGPAWTGLNLRDEAAKTAEQDTLLTDLVILRAPIGQNRSSTQRTRRRAWGFTADVFEASIRLRQGIGRLVRRPGVKFRRLWVLDSRLSIGHKQTFRPLAALLNGYPHRATFGSSGLTVPHQRIA
jgi:ATP-dependent DNA helicase DinG